MHTDKLFWKVSSLLEAESIQTWLSSEASLDQVCVITQLSAELLVSCQPSYSVFLHFYTFFCIFKATWYGPSFYWGTFSYPSNWPPSDTILPLQIMVQVYYTHPHNITDSQHCVSERCTLISYAHSITDSQHWVSERSALISCAWVTGHHLPKQCQEAAATWLCDFVHFPSFSSVEVHDTHHHYNHHHQQVGDYS